MTPSRMSIRFHAEPTDGGLELIVQVGGQAAITLQLEADEVQDLVVSLETAMRGQNFNAKEAGSAPHDVTAPDERPNT